MFYVKAASKAMRYKQCSNALFVKAYKQCSNVLAFMSKRYKQCSNALFVKALQTLQTLHIFESQARVRIIYNIILPPYDTSPQIYHLNSWENGI